MHTGVWCINLKNKDYLVELGIDGRTILTWVLVKYDGRVWPGLIWFRIERIIGPL
jgi:hypothetical protein